MTRRILITGGSGYVGGRVARALADSGEYEVVLGSRRAQPADRIPGARFVAMDWSTPAGLAAACEGMGVVLHLAAMNEAGCRADPVAALRANGVNTVSLLEAAIAAGASRFVYLSTAQVYGAPLAGRIDEATLPRPANAYASSHRAGEDAVLAAHDAGRLTGIAIRMSNAFGAPLQRDVDCWMLLANDLCRQAVTQARLVLKSTGLQLRNFIPMGDATRAIAHLLSLEGSRAGDGLFNVGAASSMSVYEMARLIQSRCEPVLGVSPQIARPEPAPGERAAQLDFRSDKLASTGFAAKGAAAAEIDATLLACKAWFAKGT